MTPLLAVPLFVLSLVAALAAAGLFAKTLDRLGVRVGLPEALLGLLTALAADGPEIASVIVALVKGATAVSLGVVVGSNVFNLAAMLGFSALLAGSVMLPRQVLAIEAAAALLAATIAAAVVFAGLPASVAAALVVVALVPYLLVLSRGSRFARRLPFSEQVDRRLARALAEREHWGHHHALDDTAVWRLVGMMVPAAALIVLGAIGMVESAITLAGHWGVPRTIVGVLILAPLTSLPNAYTAVRLGQARRGAALVSETLNSNTINLVAGLVLPALFVSVAARGALSGFAFGWLALMTVTALGLLGRRGGLGRLGGALLVVLYLVFCAVELAYS